MSLKEVSCAHHGCTVKMGRRRPATLMKGLWLHDVRYKLNVVPPPTCDYSRPSLQSLTNIFGNDRLGDCVIAMGYHFQGIVTGNSGQLFIPSPQQIIADYSAIGGYVPGNPATDQGCDEATAMKHWTNHGFANGDKLIGAILIDPTDANLIRQAIYLFENLGFGCELPDKWVNPMPQGPNFVWDVAGDPDPMNGHAFLAYGYGNGVIDIDTWGLIPGMITDGAIAKYAANSANGNLWVMLSRLMMVTAQQKAPNGLDWATIVTDFNAMGGQVPLPTPTPTPTPPPSGSMIVVDVANRMITVPSGVQVTNQPIPQVMYFPGRHVLAFDHNRWKANQSPPSATTINIDPNAHTVHVPTGFMPVHMPGQVVEVFPGRHAVSWPQNWHRA